ncbi:MAG: GNAT family N-acetyltransferase, partial [Alphaproteobacteria bacterium]
AVVTIETIPSDFWRDGLAHLTGQDERQQIIFNEMLERVDMPLYCASIIEEDEIIACGLGVGSKKYLGLFEFATNFAHRRKGLAGAITRALFARAIADGMTTAYLQVVCANEGGRAFWEHMGFTEVLYGYHYRTKL